MGMAETHRFPDEMIRRLFDLRMALFADADDEYGDSRGGSDLISRRVDQ